MTSAPSPRPTPLDSAFAGELIGAPVHLEHPGLGPSALEGTLVDETMNTFLVRGATGRTVRVPKSGLRGTIFLDGRSLPLNGEALRLRPEDRTKRLAARGRRP